MSIKAGLALMGVISVLSFGASAAQSVSADQAQAMQSLGVVTVSGIDGSPSDISAELSHKADEMGASAYRVTEAYMNGNYHETAEIYK